VWRIHLLGWDSTFCVCFGLRWKSAGIKGWALYGLLDEASVIVRLVWNGNIKHEKGIRSEHVRMATGHWDLDGAHRDSVGLDWTGSIFPSTIKEKPGCY